MSTKTSKENNQSKKSVCCGAEKMIPGDYVSGVGVFPGDPICSKCQKPWEPCHSSQDLEGEKKCCETKNQFMGHKIHHCEKCWHINMAHSTSQNYCKDEDCQCHSKPVSEKKCEEKGYHTGYHSSQEPVSEGKEKSQPFQCFQFGCWIAPEGIIHKKECKYNVDTPPSNALRSEEWEEDFDQQFLQEVILDQEVRTVVKGIKLFITKLLTSERQRAYLRGCKDENIISKDLCELARADERKKMGKKLKELNFMDLYLKYKNKLEYTIIDEILDIGIKEDVLALLNKPQDK